jgi:hypothetical protein
VAERLKAQLSLFNFLIFAQGMSNRIYDGLIFEAGANPVSN